MKLYDEEILTCKGGKKRTLFALGIEEVELITGLVRKAYEYFPLCPRTQQEYNRLRNIRKVLNNYLKEKNDKNC